MDRMIAFMLVAIEAHPGWVKTMDQYGMDKVTHTQFSWRLMPKTFKEATNVVVYGHPGGPRGIYEERRFGVQL